MNCIPNKIQGFCNCSYDNVSYGEGSNTNNNNDKITDIINTEHVIDYKDGNNIDTIFNHCVNKIVNELPTEGYNFKKISNYIGVTGHRENRLKYHKKNKGYHYMIILAKNVPKTWAIAIEQSLIDIFGLQKKNTNITIGGEGITNSSNSIYILFPNKINN